MYSVLTYKPEQDFSNNMSQASCHKNDKINLSVLEKAPKMLSLYMHTLSLSPPFKKSEIHLKNLFPRNFQICVFSFNSSSEWRFVLHTLSFTSVMRLQSLTSHLLVPGFSVAGVQHTTSAFEEHPCQMLNIIQYSSKNCSDNRG